MDIFGWPVEYMHPFYDPIRPPEDEGERKITHKRCY